MKINTFSSFLFLSFLLLSQSLNPIAQTYYTADPACLVADDTFYVYTGHDKDNSKNYDMPDWLLFSSTDMANWVNYGPVLEFGAFSWAKSKNGAWAAQVIERNKKFYYYVTIFEGNGSKIGVGVSDSPKGPFKDAIGKPLLQGVWQYIDPTVFIDDDGQAYLYWGNTYLWYVKLNENMISYSGKVEQIGIDKKNFPNYTEAPWLYKSNGIYYMLYACYGLPEGICYSTGPSATGPWTFAGDIMPNNQKGKAMTIHPAICDFKGKHYFVYHTGRLPGGGDYTRSVAVDEFEYTSDGKIPKILFSDEGPEQVELVDPFKKTPAYLMNYEEGVEIHNDYGYPFVAEIQNKDFIKVKGVNFGEGAKKFIYRVASGSEGGVIELRVDKKDGEKIGSCKVSNTGEWTTWKTMECDVKVSDVHDLFMIFTGGKDYLFDFEWWQFE